MERMPTPTIAVARAASMSVNPGRRRARRAPCRHVKNEAITQDIGLDGRLGKSYNSMKFVRSGHGGEFKLRIRNRRYISTRRRDRSADAPSTLGSTALDIKRR